MSTDDDKRLADLLLAALEKPEAKRREFLEEACDDPALVEEAWACLEAEDELGSFLEEPAFAVLKPSTDNKTSTARPGAAASRTTKEDARGRFVQRRLGAYRVVDKIGAGGMGEVYVGEDERLGRRVAVKMLPRDTARRLDWLQRFEREARVLASLNHPNIVTIHSVEEDDGIPFLTMELVDGQTLRETIPDGGLPADDVLGIASQLADALAAAHERGVIHRDLKPANVMVTRGGHTAPGRASARRAKILDFGIAKARDQAAISHDGAMVGTVPYMSPEQLRSGSVDARSDLFSLGVVLYEMLSGRHPFPGEGVFQRVTAILESDPAAISSVRDDVPEALTAMIRRLLEKRPEDRYPSAGEVRDELERLREERLAARLLESRSDPRNEAKHRSRRGFLAAAAAILAAVALGFALRNPSTPPGSPAGSGELARTALAVLYFKNLTGEPELEWLSSGLPELLAIDLSQSPELDVVSTGAFYRLLEELGGPRDRAPPEVLRQAAEAGKVDAVVRGSFARLDGVMRISYTVDEARSGRSHRSQSLQGQGEKSLFGLVDQMSAAILESFDARRPALGPATVEEATTSSVAAWQAYSRAQALYLKESRPEEAVAMYERALRLDPDFALARVHLAKIHQSLGRSSEAQELTRGALELTDQLPLDVKFAVEAGYYGARWATTARAIETYELGLKVYPDEEGWRNNLARRYAYFERYEEAIEEFEKLIEAGIGYWGDYYGAANSYAALGDFETGYRLLADFLQEKPENWWLRFSLAWHLSEWGRFEEAAAELDRLAEQRSDTAQIPYGRWRLEVLREDWAGAEREARRLLELSGMFARWRGNLSLAKSALYHGRSEEALSRFDAAAAARSGADRALARCFKAELLLARGEPGPALKEARSAQEEGRAQWPELRGYYLAALAEQALGRPAVADAMRETLRERWRRQPNAVEERQIHHLSGLLALARGEPEAALTELERAAALLPAVGIEFSWHVLPDHVPIWTHLGEAELAVGRPDPALGWLERATASRSEHLEHPVSYVRSFFLRGLAHRERGERGEARRHFERFLAYWADGDLHRGEVERARSYLAEPGA